MTTTSRRWAFPETRSASVTIRYPRTACLENQSSSGIGTSTHSTRILHYSTHIHIIILRCSAEVKISTDCGAPTTPFPTKQPSVPVTESPVAVSTPRPTISNAPTLKSEVAESREDSRLIAYLGNWQACPTDDMLDAYTHIVIAFAASYTWSAAKNNCDTSCSVSAPPDLRQPSEAGPH